MSLADLPPDGGLVYYPDSEPGIARKRRGRGFSYHGPDGALVDTAERERLVALAVPPAYDDVWLSPYPNGHLQATGRDEKGRKQYRYHPDWTAHQYLVKFDGLVALGRALPRLRRWIASHLRGDVGAFETALAATLALIDRASLRVGDPGYTLVNGSHGATTLLPEHVETDGGAIALSFIAKGGQAVEKALHAPKLAEVLEESQDLPGAHLISWIDTDGTGYGIRGEQINAKLRDLCGEGVTAKALRTWNGTHAAFMVATTTEGSLTISAMASAAADRLHNTETIARGSYIHPSVIALAEWPADERLALLEGDTPRGGWRVGEAALVSFLEGSTGPA